MVFSSNLFLFSFLPIVLSFYFLIPERHRNAYLFGVGVVFYFWGSGPVTGIFLLCIVVNYSSGRWITRATPAASKLILAGVVVLDLSFLVYYKYFNFVAQLTSDLLRFLGIHWTSGSHVALPIGISFFTFQALSYPIEIYRRVDKPLNRLVDFGAYLAMFPHLIAGPIVRCSDISKEIRQRTVTVDQFFSGTVRFTLGLAKKVVIANQIGSPVDKIFKLSPEELTTPLAWLGIVCYAFQIYYDFSGYSDMAIGMGRMLGFEFPENFDQPYRSHSVTEFWRRWHMTLSKWFRDFLYIPLGGNRLGPGRTYFNLAIVFFLCGLWHGASWTFVFWGIFHGTLLIAERMLRVQFGFQLRGWWGNAATVLLVFMGWVLFRADSLHAAGSYFLALFRFQSHVSEFETFPFRYYLQNSVAFVLILGAFFAWLPCERLEIQHWLKKPAGVVLQGAVSLFLLFYSAAVLAESGFNPFIYFRF